MDQHTAQQAKGGMWTKVILIVLAGFIGYFIGRGNLNSPADLTANTADTLGTEATEGATLGENGAMNKTETTGGEMAVKTGTESPNLQLPVPTPAPTPTTVTPSATTPSAGAMMEENAITVANQPAGTNVAIASLKLSANAWVAIHDAVNGKPGNILGARRYFKGGPVDPVVLLRATQAGTSYIAMIHNDDGDTTFSFKGGDGPLVGKDGSPIMAMFTAQ